LGMLACFVGAGLRLVGIAGNGIGSLSTNGLVGGLAGGIVPHNTGSAGGDWAKTRKGVDFFDVKTIGPKTVAAPAADPSLSISLLVIPEP
jgi:hypothetical protein